jgi:hypothetical protein
MILPEDFSSHERTERNLDALKRYRIEEITGPGAAFDQAYAALWEEFGLRGELELPEVLLGELKGRPANKNLQVGYHLMSFFEGKQLVGVRDVFSVLDSERKSCYVLLSHSLVLPPWRRSGVGALIRAAPAAIGRRALAQADYSQGELLLMAEMDPLDPASDPTMIRLLAYGGAGYRVIPPQVLPYVQPDFSGWQRARRDPHPLPLMIVYRWVGHEQEPALPGWLGQLLADGIDEIHRQDNPEDTQARRENMQPFLDKNEAFSSITVHRGRLSDLSPILKANALPLFSIRLGGTEGAPSGDATLQLEQLLQKWGYPT